MFFRDGLGQQPKNYTEIGRLTIFQRRRTILLRHQNVRKDNEGAVLETNEIIGEDGDRIFANSRCMLVGFEFDFKKKEDFLFDEFVKETGWEGRRRFRNTCGAKHKSTDYHLHLTWRVTPPHSILLTVEFTVGHRAPDKGEVAPFAEDFLGWFKRFILTKETSVDIYSNFDFPIDPNRKLRFPLPMRAPIGPGQVEGEIDGISFKLSPPVSGIEKIWITQGPKEVNLHLHAKKILQIDSLDPRKEILETSGVLESLFERRELIGEQS